MDRSLYYYTGFTLVDITATGNTRGVPSLSRSQQSNWESVIQTIGIIAQPLEMTNPVTITVNLDYMEFGEMYQGVHEVWAWQFAVEYAGVFERDSNPVGRLEDCFDQVPVVCGLTETARFLLPIFYTGGAIKNIYFKNDRKNLNNI
jgi:hypothetical protein